MKLNIKLTGLLKFQKLYSNSRYSKFLKLYLEQDSVERHIFYIDDNIDILELRRILVSNKIDYIIEKN